MYRGDIRLGDTVDVKFTTRSFTTGVPTTLAGTPAISAYVGNGTTQITAGITLTVDFDAVTGLHNVRVVATSGNGYATATNVDLVITTGTVGGVSVVGEVIGSFSIEARSALMPTTVARTLDVSATGEAGIDWANVGSPTTAVNLSATNIDPDQVVASVTGAVGSVTGAVGSVTGAVGSVTGNVGGNVTGSVGSVTGLTNATIADAVWDEDATAHQTQGTFGQAIGDPGADTDTIWALANTNLDAAVSSRLSTAGYTAPPSAASVADAVWDEAQADHVAVGSFGITASEIADILVDTAEIGAAGAGLTNINLPNQTMDIVGNITGSLSGSVGSVTGAVGSVTGNVGGNVVGSVASVTAGVTVTTNNDKTGYALSAAGVDAIWDEATAGHTTAGTTGKALIDAGSAGDPWSTAVPGAYGAGTAGFILGTNLDVASSTLATAAALTTVDDFLDTEVAAILAAVDTEVAAIKAKTDNLPAAPAATGDIPTAAAVADAVWDEILAGHLGVGSTGEALNAAGAAGDPWTTALPGAYGAGSAGFIIGTNVNAPIGTVDTVVDAIKAKTDSLTFTVAGQVDANIQYVAGTVVTGVGTEADPWGP